MQQQLAYTIPQAAEQLGLGRTSLYGLITSGELRAIKVGRRTVISHRELETFLEKRSAI